MARLGNSDTNKVRHVHSVLVTVLLLELTNTFVPTVLRGKCLSVDEPIQGSTPALAITPTPKCSSIIGVLQF